MLGIENTTIYSRNLCADKCNAVLEVLRATRRPDLEPPVVNGQGLQMLLPLAGSHGEAHHAPVSLELLLMGASVAVATAGILIAIRWYGQGAGETPQKIAQASPESPPLFWSPSWAMT